MLFVTLSGWATQGPSITASTVAVVSGVTTAVVPIKVADANFVAVGSFSLTFTFDYTNLGIPTVTYTNPAFATAGWAAFAYTTDHTIYETGKFVVTGMGPQSGPGGVDLSSGDVMFTITFTKAAGITSCGIVNFNDSPTLSCEFTGVAPDYDVFTDGTYTNGKAGVNSVYVDHAGPAGCSTFLTIQAAVDFLETGDAGGTISIKPDTYIENVIVTKTGITFDNSVAGTVVIDGNLTIPAAGTTLTLACDLTVTGILTLTDADDYLIIGTNILTLNGTIAGLGSLTSTSSSTLRIGGSGSPFGTINLDGNLNEFKVDRNAQTITLGTCTSYPIEITTLNLTAGELVLGDNALQINTTYTPGATGTFSSSIVSFAYLDFRGATSGAIKFSSSLELPYLYINTSLSIDIATAITMLEADVNTGTLTNSAAVNVGNLINAATVTMGADITVTGNFSPTVAAAVVNVNAYTLTLNGNISPFDDTYIVAGSTSSLAFGGASPLPAYIMPADIASLKNLEINRELGVTMAVDLDLLGTLALTSGTFTMDGNNLTIHNPMTIASGILSGDLAAKLMIEEATITPGANIALPAINLNELYINNSGGVTVLANYVDIKTKLYLELGAVTNGNKIMMENSSTIERSGGSLLAEPFFLSSVNILYTNTSSITSGYELPTGTVTTDVTLSGAGGVVMGATHTINSLTLTSGKLTLGAYDLITTATTDGSSSSYVIADGAGTFTVKGVLAADVFPVGYAGNYTPLTISNSIASDFSVNLKNVTTLAGFIAPVPSPNFVKLQWVITRAFGGTAAVTFKWNVAEKFTTDPTAPVLGRYNGTDWVSAGTAGSWTPYTNYTVAVTGITTFSPFAAYGDLITPVYVDDAIGDPTYTGENAANSPPGTGPKKTIQQGLTVVANPGTINVAAGPYPENIIVNKDVTIHGAGVTTIVNGTAATANGSVFNIATSGVTLEYMKINNTAASNALYAVRVDPSLINILIQENTITNNFINGIVFNANAGTNNVVLRNKFEGTSTDPAVSNEGTTTVIGLRNYWGSDNGPTITPVPPAPSVNPCGDGKLITALVTYDPWMNSTLTSDIYQGKRVISGTFYYPNKSGTDIPMIEGGIDLTLKRTSDNTVMDATTTNGSGYYAFAGQCTNCSYYIVVTSDNTTEGSVNGTDAAQVNYWGPHPSPPSGIYVVRFFAGDVTGGKFINSTDALDIQQHFVNGTAFTRSKWSFYDKVTKIVDNFAPTPADDISIDLQRTMPGYGTSTAYDQGMYGLATGDFNRSFDPTAKKSASATLQLVYGGTKQVGSNQEFDLPIRIVNGSEVGAVSLILNFPANMVEVKDVVMNSAGGMLDWAVKGNELRIGWNSSVPLNLSSASELLTLRLKTATSFTKGASIRFALASNPLNEMADDHYEVISNAILSVDVIDAAGVGIEEQPAENGLTLSNHPNPFNSYTMINYSLPFEGKVTLEICNLLGKTVKILVNELQTKGDHSLKFDAGSLSPGVYTATIRLGHNSDELIRTIKLVNNNNR
ncbi:MAG: T9SS type A sorting domain-containing protein [Bacteroidetes bacterium]|nr:T9SS type A sorting domain-containing protein [Bacteroidota bacterium]